MEDFTLQSFGGFFVVFNAEFPSSQGCVGSSLGFLTGARWCRGRVPFAQATGRTALELSTISFSLVMLGFSMIFSSGIRNW